MTAYLLPGLTGLLLGLLLHWAGFSRAGGVRAALSFRRSYPLRSGLSAVGLALAMTALLMWLAVIDVDEVTVLPLSAGALAGGAVMGIAIALCGATPSTAFAMLGGGNIAEALSILAGCLGMTLLLPSLDDLLSPLRTAAPFAEATLFRVTLDEPFLLGGGFGALACLGLLLWVFALCLPSPKPELAAAEAAAAAKDIAPEETAGAEASAEPKEPALPEEPVEEDAAVEAEEPVPEEASTEEETAPEDAVSEEDASADEEADDLASDTFVSLLEGEEPLVIDTDATGETEENKSGK